MAKRDCILQEFEIVGLGIDKQTDYPLILLQSSKEKLLLPIYVGPAEAQSIAFVLEDDCPERPLSHDLLISTINKLKASIDRIEIHTVKNKIFHADLVLVDETGREIFLDARPSDCLAVAVRVDISIFVSEQVINLASIDSSDYFNQEEMINSEASKEDFLNFLNTVKASDFNLEE